MKTFSFIFIFSFLFHYSYCQRPTIDSSVYGKWPNVESGSMSDDGEYISYLINNMPVGGKTLVIKSVMSNWEVRFIGQFSAVFTQDSKMCIFENKNDSLCIIELGTDSIVFIANVRSYRISGQDRYLNLSYINETTGELFVWNLYTGGKMMLGVVSDYVFSDDGRKLLFTKSFDDHGRFGQSLVLTDGCCIVDSNIWNGEKIENFVFDKSEKQFAFVSERFRTDKVEKEIWFYSSFLGKAIKLADDSCLLMGENLIIKSIEGFSRDGERIIFTMEERAPIKRIAVKGARVDVWSYKDAELQSEQLMKIRHIQNEIFYFILNIRDGAIFPLIKRGESLEGNVFGKAGVNNWVLIAKKDGDGSASEANWNPLSNYSIYLESTVDGRRREFKELKNYSLILSPQSKFIVYYNFRQHSYFSYDIATKTFRNITNRISTNWLALDNDDFVNSNRNFRGVAGWACGDSELLIYDRDDIWLIDPTSRRKPVNVTNGLGSKKNITFYLAKGDYNANEIISPAEKLILIAFNRNTKENGFYEKMLDGKGDPVLLSMGPYIFDIPQHPTRLNGAPIIKAGNLEAYLVRREDARESPNYYFTTDFKKFISESDIHPERDFNWLTTKLVTWRGIDGETLRGVLYKPENFDSNKKYPVIFTYYQIRSDGLNGFLMPETSNGEIDIPTYVSNGYLVVTPDIHYTIGSTGKSAMNSIMPLVKKLSQLSWVDSKRMGIQGFSYGAIQTNYLITHTHTFAAASSSSGIYDFVSSYGSISAEGTSLQSLFEIGQGRMGASLWQKPDLYIENSSIFNADKVSTPLLMMHTTNDADCLFGQALEFFTALRRLNKKVWMLQYDGNHGLRGGSAYDFTIRMRQFFDYYLKRALPPKWMTDGIPASNRGVDLGLDPDDSGRVP